MKDLKKIQKDYEQLAIQFAELNNQYKETLTNYEDIKISLDSNNANLDSITLEMNRLHEMNINLYDSLLTRTSVLLAEADFEITIDSTSEVVDLEKLFGN